MKHYLSCLVFLSVFLLGSGCGGGDITLNGAEVGEEVFTAYCAAAVDCGFIAPGDAGVCVDAAVQAMCEDGVCGNSYTMPEDEWNACVDAVRDMSCAAVDAAIFPSECQTIEALQ
jgi:hypothetical protein